MSLKDRIANNYQHKDDYSNVDRKTVFNLPKGLKFYKPSVDKINKIVILPYQVETGNDAKVTKGEDTYVFEYFQHRNVGVNQDSFLCNKRTYGKACPICEEIDQLREDYEKNKDLIGNLKAQKKVIYNVLDLLSDDSEEVLIFDASHAFFESELLEETTDPETKEVICFPDPSEDGYIIKFRATEETFGKAKFNKYKGFRFEKRGKAISKDILNKAISFDKFVIIPEYEDVKNAFLGIESGKEEEQPEPKGNKEDLSEKHKAHDLPKDLKENKKAEKKTGKCPSGHEFGTDVDAFDECIKCEIWEDCSEEAK